MYKGWNARSKVHLSKVYFCEMYSTCVSSKLCEFIFGVFSTELLTSHCKNTESESLTTSRQLVDYKTFYDAVFCWLLYTDFPKFVVADKKVALWEVEMKRAATLSCYTARQSSAQQRRVKTHKTTWHNYPPKICNKISTLKRPLARPRDVDALRNVHHQHQHLLCNIVPLAGMRVKSLLKSPLKWA